MNPVLASLERFVTAYRARPDLVQSQRGWQCTIVVLADDTGHGATVRIADGVVTAMSEGAAEGTVITAAEAILCAVLDLRMSPTEPYLFGELTVRGPEGDYLRLDYLTTMLCPR